MSRLHVVDCVWTEWGTWGSCSQTCGGATQLRSRRVMTHEENGGDSCTGDSSELQVCGTENCPQGKYICNTYNINNTSQTFLIKNFCLFLSLFLTVL